VNRTTTDAYVSHAVGLMEFPLDGEALERVRIEFGRIAEIASELLAEAMPVDIEPLPTYRP
jgi:hypothetical protein